MNFPLPDEVPMTDSDNAAVRALLMSALTVFKLGARHLAAPHRPELARLLDLGTPLTMSIRMLPTPYIEVMIEDEAGQEHQLFAMPLAAPAEPDQRPSVQ